MTEQAHIFEMYPKFRPWYTRMDGQQGLHPSQQLLFQVMKSLIVPAQDMSRNFNTAIEDFLRISANHRDDFVITDEIANELDATILELFTMYVEKSFHVGVADKSVFQLGLLAQKTALSPVRFLYAWTLLNLNRLDDCISECEKESNPTAQINTLLGQALLESGQTLEAIDALTLAIKLDPRDPMIRVQLIKALIVEKKTEEAIKQITACRNITGRHLEITGLGALAALQDQPLYPEFVSGVLNDVMEHLDDFPANVELFNIGIKLAYKYDLGRIAKEVIAKFDAVEASKDKGFGTAVVQALRLMTERKWDGAIAMLSGKAAIATSGRGFN